MLRLRPSFAYFIAILFAYSAHVYGEALQSAFLMRSSPPTVEPATSADRIAALQRHFDEVLSILESHTDASIAESLDRLAATRGMLLSSAERQTWTQRLLAARAENVRRLREYRDRGLFPINNLDVEVKPIFVDSKNTACAVGYLMRQSGWQEEVQEIARADNFVYVPDVESGALVDWLLESGLTQAEAALIQPGYFFGDHAITQLQAFGTFERDGLRYSNFDLELESSVTQGWVTNADAMFAMFGNPTHPADFGTTYHETAFGDADVGNRWVFFGEHAYATTAIISMGSAELRLGFDVETIDPNDRFVGLTTAVTPAPPFGYGTTYFSNPAPEDWISISTSVRGADGTLIASQVLDRNDAVAQGANGLMILDEIVGGDFAAEQSLSVEVSIELVDESPDFDTYFGSFAIAMDVVPEPTSWALVVGVAFGLFGAYRHWIR